MLGFEEQSAATLLRPVQHFSGHQHLGLTIYLLQHDPEVFLSYRSHYTLISL